MQQENEKYIEFREYSNSDEDTPTVTKDQQIFLQR